MGDVGALGFGMISTSEDARPRDMAKPFSLLIRLIRCSDIIICL
jgi:hypothetical protein